MTIGIPKPWRPWSVLPGIFWSHAVARKKPAARILAEHSDPSRRTHLKSEPEPVIAVHTVGGGARAVRRVR